MIKRQVEHIFPRRTLDLRPANGRRRYFVTTSLIGWEQAMGADQIFIHVICNDTFSTTDKRPGVSNHWQPTGLFNSFRLTSDNTSKLRIDGPFCGNPQVTGKFPSQRASNAESVLCHDVIMRTGGEINLRLL